MMRPFDNFHTAITDPAYFIGRRDQLDHVQNLLPQVCVVLGGRRFGKSSYLRASNGCCYGMMLVSISVCFPFFWTCNSNSPPGWAISLSHDRAIEAGNLAVCQGVPRSGLREMYRSFLNQVTSTRLRLDHLSSMWQLKDSKIFDHDSFSVAFLNAADEVKEMGFDGVCFLLDEADFIVRRAWSDEVCGYLRGIKDSDTRLRQLLGLVLTGFRDLRNYRQHWVSAG